jgi:hypothetical protein
MLYDQLLFFSVTISILSHDHLRWELDIKVLSTSPLLISIYVNLWWHLTIYASVFFSFIN